jgi:hypothetical protein
MAFKNDYDYAQVPQTEMAQPPVATFYDTPGVSEINYGGVGNLGYVDPYRENAFLAASTLFTLLQHQNMCKVETGSVYGPAICMPQFARSAGYPRRITELGLRSLVFVFANIAVQGWILVMFSKEQLVMNKLSGRMSLCDFGAHMDQCPEGPGCLGPGGTRFEPLRLYPFTQWSTRTFVRDTLKIVFPERADEIQNRVDPGEYGVESRYCRFLCCFLFMMAVTKDAFQIMDLMRLLWHVPTSSQPWLSYTGCIDMNDPSSRVNLDGVKLKIAGMPVQWKLFNVLFILLPKCLLWLMTAELGVAFLMDTSGIADLVVNSMALAFILSIDELMFETATAGRTKYMMDNLEPYHLQKAGEEKEDNLGNALADDTAHCCCMDLFPYRLVVVVILTTIFVTNYYITRCFKTKDGMWASLPVYVPRSLTLSVWTAFFPSVFPYEYDNNLLWSMPGEQMPGETGS